MYRLRRLAAVVAAFAAVALTVSAPAGAHGTPHQPEMHYCHFWDKHTMVHWDMNWIRSDIAAQIGPIGAPWEAYNVSWHFFSALGAQLFPFPADSRMGNEIAETVTPLFAATASATIVVARPGFDGMEFRRYDAPAIGCTT